MSKSEEEYLLEQNKNEVEPFFDAPDQKILATGDMFRGASTGIFSEFDLNNPGQKLVTSEEKIEDDFRKGKY